MKIVVRHIYPSLVLVEPRRTRPCITERLLMGRKESNQTKSKVMSILITGNILHESSSAPQQHKSVQYKWFALYLHRDVSYTDMLQPHFISCSGASGAGGNMRGSRNFCQFYLVLGLFYSLKRGSNDFIAEKTNLRLYQGSRGGPLYSGGGGGVVSTFSRGEGV